MEKMDQRKKTVKALATTILGVGFVAPFMFGNIVEAVNYGAGGIGQWLNDDVLNKTDSAKWAVSSTGASSVSDDNCVMLHGYRFKIVAVDDAAKGKNAKVTLWSYDKVNHGSEAGFGSAAYNSSGTWGSDVNKAYVAGGLATKVNGLWETKLAKDSRVQEIVLAGDEQGSTNIEYQNEDGSQLKAKVWLPSYKEIFGEDDGWGLSSSEQRSIDDEAYEWLRTPVAIDSTYAGTSLGGFYMTCIVSNDTYSLRPALQILNQTTTAFSSRTDLSVTKGVFTVNADSGTEKSYVVDSSTPITVAGVTLNGSKLSVGVTNLPIGYVLAGLLTSETDAVKNDTWEHLNGQETGTLGISHMAQADGLSFKPTNEQLSGKALKVFGLKENGVTELSDKAITNLSVVGTGEDAKMHIQIGGATNSDLTILLQKLACADLVGDATNTINVSGERGVLNLGTSTYAGTVFNESGELIVIGAKGTLGCTVEGAGTIIIGDGDDTEDVITATTSLGKLKISKDGNLITNADDLKAAIDSNEGTVTLTGGTLKQGIVTAGKLNIGNGDGNPDRILYEAVLDDLGADVTINSDGVLVIKADNLRVLPENKGGRLALNGGTLSIPVELSGGETMEITSPVKVGTGAKFTQKADSSLVVPAALVEATGNDPDKAFLQGIDFPEQLDISMGNLILSGKVEEGKFYVLVAGDAIKNGKLTSNNLWTTDNITVDGAFNTEYVTMAAGDSSIAIQITNKTSFEEANTSGLAAVQQGALTAAKEITSEVENHLGITQKRSLDGSGKHGKEVWASHIRTKESTENMKLEGINGDNTAQYNGAVIGADFYSSRKAIAGVAFSYISGNINSYSGQTGTRNDSKYYGISVYDKVTNGDTALIYDIGYVRGDNDIAQHSNGKEITSDVKSDSYSAGVRFEKAIGLGRTTVVPFASFRYMRVNNKDYTNSHSTKFAAGNQNLYIPKVGIAWAGDFLMPKSTWTWRPSVEAGYVWNLGDRNVNGAVYTGGRSIGIEYDTVDKSSYYAKAGMEFVNKRFTAGVSYRYMKGAAVRNNKWNINVSWQF